MDEISNKKVLKTYYKCELRKITGDDAPTLNVNVIDWCLESLIVFANENKFSIAICGSFKK